MLLIEADGKALLREARIATPDGTVATDATPKLSGNGPWIVKAQVPVGGRGKAGGVKLANDADEVRLHAGNILGLDIKGHVVKRLWIEDASDIDREYYFSINFDRTVPSPSPTVRPRGVCPRL